MSDEIDYDDHEVDDTSMDEFEDEVEIPEVDLFGTESVPPFEHEGTEGLNDN